MEENNMKHSAFHPEKMYTYLRGYASALGMKDTLKALTFAREKHKDQFRKSGEPYIVHPLTMACNAVSISSAIPSSPSQLEWMIGLPWANTRGSLYSHCNSRIPRQLEKNNVAPPSSKYEAPISYSVSREVPCSVLKCETVLGTLDATPKFP